MYIYMSENDWIIGNCLTNEFAKKFIKPTRATATDGEHSVPRSVTFGPPDVRVLTWPPRQGNEGFEEAVSFLRANHTDGSYIPPAPTPYEEQISGCPGFLLVILRWLWRLYWWAFILVILCCCGSIEILRLPASASF